MSRMDGYDYYIGRHSKSSCKIRAPIKNKQVKRIELGKINTFFSGFGGETDDGNGLAEN